MRVTSIVKRFQPSRSQFIGGAIILTSGVFAFAAVPNTFTDGTTISASQVNTNFSTADTRITAIENLNSASRLSTLEANPSISGNLTLVPSTSTAGNIMKNGARFLHNFGGLNTFLGENAGNFTLTNTFNTAVGANVLYNLTNGHSNTGVGESALYSTTGGTYNAANGSGALAYNTTGSFNTASGASALYDNTTGLANTASGTSALLRNTTGSNNIAMGWEAGKRLTTGDFNIAIGNEGVAAESNTIRIGAVQTRAFIAGISGVTSAGGVAVYVNSSGQLGTATSSRRFKDSITDMGDASSLLMKLHPVTFRYKSDKQHSLQYGLIAEEVNEVAPGLVARNANGEIETVYYQYLTPMLLNEYQKQQHLIEAQALQLKTQAERLAAVEAQAKEIVALKQQLAQVTVALLRIEHPEKMSRAAR